MSKGGLEPFERGRTAGDPGPDVDRTEALRERLFGNAVGALGSHIYLGERLGLYRALAEGGAATSSQLAVRTGTSERYVREWLEHHAASELLVVDDPRAEPLARRYWLPPEHIPVLANRDDVRYEACTGVDIVRAGRGLPQLVEAFRVGNAPPPLPWEPEGRAEPTGPGSSICLAPNGFRRLSTSTCGFVPNRQRGSSTWPAAPAGRASLWPRRIPTSTWTASISTTMPSAPLAGTLSGRAPLIE